MQGDAARRRGGRQPWAEVEVGTDVGSPPYRAWVDLLYGSDEAPWWLELGTLLAGRPGWHVDLNATGGDLTLLWSFGAFGSSLFNVTVCGPGEFDVFDYDADENHLIRGVDDLRAWLERNEERHADPFAKVHGWISADDWWLFRRFPFDVRVTVDEDGRWLATVAGLPAEVGVAADLPAAVAAVRELLCTAAGAPADLAGQLRMTVRLDAAASAALGAPAGGAEAGR